MNRLSVSLTVIVVLLTFVSGFLFYQNNYAQALNKELRSQNVDVQNQLNDLEIQNDELGNQINDLQTQNNELQEQIDDQQAENSILQNQIDEEQNRSNELENQTQSLLVQINEIQDQLDTSQNQTNYLHNQASEQLESISQITYELALERPLDVLISKFDWDWSFNPYGGLTVSYPINITVTNIDVTALGGLTINARLLKKGTLTELYASHGFSAQIGNLQAGESQQISGEILAPVGFNPESAVCSIKLSAKSIVLDEKIWNLPAGSLF
ncbi:MAG: hypothetical protein PVI43_06635 [Candidatus Bathyarchaeota archaeon]|jgi:hypothetical protein